MYFFVHNTAKRLGAQKEVEGRSFSLSSPEVRVRLEKNISCDKEKGMDLD